MWLIYHQFFSEKTIDCFHQQARTLRDEGVIVPITTNMMPTWYGYDHEQMATALDVVAVDHYGLQDKTLFGPDYLHELFTHAYSRGIKGGQNIWFLEFQWGRTGNLPLPGEVRWEALTQVGFGADLLNFFRVDTCPSGLERDGFGLLGANGQPGRVFREMQTLSDELRRLKPLLDNTTAQRAEVALLFTHDNHCDFARNSKHPSFQGPSGNGYSMHLSRHFQAIARQNIPCDIVYPRGDFSAYKVIVAPALYILPQPLAEKLIRFVAGGGKLVLTSLSGIADENGRMWELPAPGPLGAIAGVEITDYGQYYAKAGPVSLVSATPAFDFPPLPAVQWIDEIIPVAPQVEVLARFDNPFYAHAAAITRHPYQAGHVYCLGAILDQQGYNQLYRALATDLDLSSLLALPEGVYVSVRRKDEREIYFINNPGIEPREIELRGEFHDLLTDTTISGRQTLPPFGVQVMSPVDER